MRPDCLFSVRWILGVCCGLLTAHAKLFEASQMEVSRACLDVLAATLQLPTENVTDAAATIVVVEHGLLDVLDSYLKHEGAWKVLRFLASGPMLAEVLHWGILEKAQQNLSQTEADQSSLHAAVVNALTATLVSSTLEEELLRFARLASDGSIPQDMTDIVAAVGSAVAGPCVELAEHAVDGSDAQKLGTLKSAVATEAQGVMYRAGAGTTVSDLPCVIEYVAASSMRHSLSLAAAKGMWNWPNFYLLILEVKNYQDEETQAASWELLSRLSTCLPSLRRQGLNISTLTEAIRNQLAKFLAPWSGTWAQGNPLDFQSRPQAHGAALRCAQQCISLEHQSKAEDLARQAMDESMRARLRTVEDLKVPSRTRLLYSPLRDKLVSVGMLDEYLKTITDKDAAHSIAKCLDVSPCNEQSCQQRHWERKRLMEICNLLLLLDPCRWVENTSTKLICQTLAAVKYLQLVTEGSCVNVEIADGEDEGTEAAPVATRHTSHQQPSISADSSDIESCICTLQPLLQFVCAQVSAAAAEASATAAPARGEAREPFHQDSEEENMLRPAQNGDLSPAHGLSDAQNSPCPDAQPEVRSMLDLLQDELLSGGLAVWALSDADLRIAGGLVGLLWNLASARSGQPELAIPSSELLWNRLQGLEDFRRSPTARWIEQTLGRGLWGEGEDQDEEEDDDDDDDDEEEEEEEEDEEGIVYNGFWQRREELVLKSPADTSSRPLNFDSLLAVAKAVRIDEDLHDTLQTDLEAARRTVHDKRCRAARSKCNQML